MQAISNKIARIIYRSFTGITVTTTQLTAILKLLQNSNREMRCMFVKNACASCGKNTKLVENVFSEMGWIEHKYKGEINYPLRIYRQWMHS